MEEGRVGVKSSSVLRAGKGPARSRLEQFRNWHINAVWQFPSRRSTSGGARLDRARESMEALIENLSMAVYMARVAGERLPDDPCAPPIVAGTPKAISERLARQGDSSGSLRGLGMISQMEKGSKCYVAAVGLMRTAAEELQAEEGGERNLTPASGAATAEAFRNLAQYARSLTGNVDGTEWGNGPEEVGGTHAKGMLMIGKLNEDEVPAAARDAAASGAGSAVAATKGRGADAPGTVRFDPLYAWTRCAVSRL